MVNTEKGIPNWMRDLAFKLWGKKCQVCKSKNKPSLHHCSYNGQDPYQDTKVFQLIPLCPSCHGKVESREDTPLRIFVRYLVNRKGEVIEKSMEDYLDKRVDLSYMNVDNLLDRFVDYLETRYE